MKKMKMNCFIVFAGVLLLCASAFGTSYQAYSFKSDDGFSDVQGENGWSYAGVIVGDDIDSEKFMGVYDVGTATWKAKEGGGAWPGVSISATSQDMQYSFENTASLRYWTADQDYTWVNIYSTLVSIDTPDANPLDPNTFTSGGMMARVYHRTVGTPEGAAATIADSIADFTERTLVSGGIVLGDSVADFEAGTVVGGGDLVADSEDDFSGTQGSDGWNYYSRFIQAGGDPNWFAMTWDAGASEWVGTHVGFGDPCQVRINSTSQQKDWLDGSSLINGLYTKREWTSDTDYTSADGLNVTVDYNVAMGRLEVFFYDASADTTTQIAQLTAGVGSGTWSANIGDFSIGDKISTSLGPWGEVSTADAVYQDVSMTITTPLVLDANGWKYELENAGAITDMTWDSGAGNYVGSGVYSEVPFELRINATSQMKEHIGGGVQQGPATRRSWIAPTDIGDVTVNGSYNIVGSARLQLFHYDASEPNELLRRTHVRDIINGAASGTYSSDISNIETGDMIELRLGCWIPPDPCDLDPPGESEFMAASMTITSVAVYDANGWEYEEHNNGVVTRMEWDPGEGDYVINGAYSGTNYQLRQNASQMMQAKIGGGATQGVGTWRTWTSDANYTALYPEGIKLTANYDVAAGRVQLFRSDASAGGAFEHIIDLVNGAGAGEWSGVLADLDVGDKIQMRHVPWVHTVANEIYQDFSIKITNMPDPATGLTTELSDWAVDVGVFDFDRLAWDYPAYRQLHNVKAGEKIYFLLQTSPTALLGDQHLMKEWISEIVGFAPTTPVNCPAPISEDLVADCNVNMQDYTALATGFGTDYTPGAPDPNVFNSKDDFSETTQGENNWYYGYLLDEDDVNDIYTATGLLTYNGAWQSWDRNTSAPRIGMAAGGGGESKQSMADGTAASARYWVAPEDCEKLKIETTVDTTGTGVQARFMIVFVDLGYNGGQAQILSEVTTTGLQLIALDATVPNVTAGDAVYFVMQGSGSGGTGTFVPWEQTITASGAEDCTDRIMLGNGMPADLDPDCTIDFSDLRALLLEWLTSY